MTSYVIRGGQEGKARLRIIAQALWPTTLDLFTRAGVESGMACLDVGCGGGDVSMELARLVGPSGAVTGIDLDHVKTQLAQQEAGEQAISNATFSARGIDELDDDAAYDLVYARFLLTHLTNPADAMRRMVRATKPGGLVVAEDLDHSGVFCHPDCPALAQYVRLYNQVVRLRGADPEIGPKLPTLFRRVGLHDLQLTHVQPVFERGNAKHIHQITLESIAPAVVAAGLSVEAGISALHAQLDEFARNPATIMSFPRIFQVWARRP